MRTKIQRWGNSLGIRIPRPFAEETGLEEQSEVELSLAEGGLVIRLVTRTFTLDELLAGIDERNLHAEVQTGPAVGREVW